MNDHVSPLLHAKAHDQPSVFRPENLLREGRLRSDHADAVTSHAAPPISTPDGDS